MKLFKGLNKRLWMLTHLPRAAKRISQLVNDPNLSRSYYPEEKRKHRIHIYMDLFLWALRYREVNSYYYFYGLDRKFGVDADDYLPYNLFRSIRDRRNQHRDGHLGFSYICLLRDKFVFSQFVSSLGFPTPKNLAFCTRSTITWLDNRREVPLETIVQDQDLEIDAFCKPLTGMGGDGVFPLRVTSRKIFQDDQEITLDQLRANLAGVYLLQQPIQQHPEMSALHSQSINAIRLVTFNNSGNVQAFWAALKVGTGGSRVDNVARGGLGVRIDLTNGRLYGDGMFLPGLGGCISRHPDTDVPFDGFEIPYFHEAVQCAIQLHQYLYNIHSIGWDIGITETGPVIIEGNDDWAGHFAMAFVPNFKSRFLEMYGKVSEII